MTCTNFQYYTGNWLLRTTNNPYYFEGNTRLQIFNDGNLCFRTKQSDFIWTNIRKKTGIYNFDADNKILTIDYNKITYYKNTFFGIQIPKCDIKNVEYNKKTNFTCLLDTYNVLYLYDKDKNYHYLFDLYIEELKTPKIETTINNFIFFQIISFIINTTLTISLKHSIPNEIF